MASGSEGMEGDGRVMADADIGGMEFLIAIFGYLAIMAGVGTALGILAGWIFGKIIDLAKGRGKDDKKRN